MLKKLTIKNYAIIDDLEIQFNEGFNIITGETGAGKSIIIGALSLLLGERIDSKALKSKNQKCIIEGHFNIKDYQLNDFFNDNDLDFDENTIIRREISVDNKSRAFINDTPCTIQILKQLGEKLVDIHSQHETLLINSSEFQLGFVDAISNIKKDTLQFAKDFQSFQNLAKEIQTLEIEYSNAIKEQDYLKFQFDELYQAELKADEQQLLEDEQSLLSNAEEIQSKISGITNILQDADTNIVDQLKLVQTQLASIEKHNSNIKQISERLKSSIIEIKDIYSELENIATESQANPNRLEIVQERLNIIYRLEQKHRVETIQDLIDIQNKLDDAIRGFDQSEENIKNKKAEYTKIQSELLKRASIISEKRKSSFKTIIDFLVNNLKGLGIPHALIEIAHIVDENQLSKTGIDDIKILFSANKGQKPESINKVASGGELSRIMLCIKALLAEKEHLPTIIFDEIDTGVSGEVAIKMGQIMRRLSNNLQVMSITHLPQIASLGNHHYFVYKDQLQNETITKMKLLSNEERIVEIAKMLSGEKPTAGALENAKELLELSIFTQ
jgi:DNA repair protein RecN (Recombination protein N)